MNLDLNFSISPSAIAEIKSILEEDVSQTYLRVSVKGGGCSGFMYGLGFETEIDEPNDILGNYDGINVIIDKKSAIYLHNVTLDWINDINQRGFKFHNPNATKTCGCGLSFQ